jgi:hypothetical protein
MRIVGLLSTRDSQAQSASPSDNGYWPGLGGVGTIVTLVIVALAFGLFLVVWSDPSSGDYGPSVPFPKIRNWQTLRVTLSRGLCFGFCPAFDVEVRGDGTVVYNGKQCVATTGRRVTHIDPSAVAALVAQFRATDYFSLRDRYVASGLDGESLRTGISFDGKKKAVLDYFGRAAGMPQNVKLLERAIERVSGADRWVYSGVRTCFGQPIIED